MDRHTEGRRPGGQRQTHRHTLQLLRCLSVTFPLDKPKHQPPEEVVSGSSAKHLPQQSRGGSSRAEAGRGLCSPQRPQPAPAPGNYFRSSILLSSLRKGSQGAEWRASQGSRAPGLGVRKERGTVGPQWERPTGREPGEEAWSGPVLQLPLGWDPKGFFTSQKPGYGDRWWLLSQTWASCCRATLSLGVPWPSVGSGRHL